ncbi:RNA polymerase sigma factor WhiG [Aciditerrimonas ferrireducens]|jgi:RNA polymerase sigma factor for flagellar operon FliA|uniref:RNA polymerase sigma factor n=1 Tax=Aciditerrimonas ferrireducens TaxID=667306 RepID=A0ABV6C808_9ACTN|nr:RNA polymerase sigma factor WhiG [Aciditerrimonas ferrireducens]MCK4177744.1 RNA polymerase sigma factor WhiG [Aciditerrimonas ferrireducens]
MPEDPRVEATAGDRGRRRRGDEPASPEELWERYLATRDPALRQQLIVLYSPLVKYVAGRVAAGLPQHVDGADLVSYGIIGLIDAIDRFDPSRAVKFETYAIPRIRGAIIDELRAIDWVPRSVRAKARAVEQAMSALEGLLHRTPTDAEVAAEMGISEHELQDILRQVSLVGVAALDEVLAGGDRSERATLGDTVADAADGPVALFEDKEAKEILAKAIARLGERERTVLSLYYYENLTLAEIGEILGVTESRVCQIHTKAVLQLRTRLGDRSSPGASADAGGRGVRGGGRPRARASVR